MNKKLVVAAVFFAFSGLSAAPSRSLAASSSKACKQVAKSAGLMSTVIDNACSGYKSYQNACLPHVEREGIPDLVRADNYMNCLCGESKQALASDASQVCHASGSIHGLLDRYMVAVQSAARDTDKRQVELASRESSLSVLRANQEDAKKDADKAQAAYQAVKSSTEKALAKNDAKQAQAQKSYEQTVAKLRAAERAAKAKFDSITQSLHADNAKLAYTLDQAKDSSVRESTRHRDVSQAVNQRQREVTQAKTKVASAILAEQRAVERHRQAMSSGQAQDSKAK